MQAPVLSIPVLAGPPRGTYLRRCWYVAGWADALGEARRTDFPGGTGRPVSRRGGRGPCRGRALSASLRAAGAGQGAGGALACPYHGLRFDGQGACVHNPHPGGQLPAARLPVYPLVERHGLLWIWMGEAEAADPALIPDFAWLTDPAWAVVRGATRAEGHYELYSDNILDLSHANFVHPALVARAFTEGERRFWQDGETVHAEYVRLDDTLSDGIGAMLGRVGQPQDFYGEVTWHAPAVLRFDYVAGPPGTPRDACTLLPSLHAFTPETPDTTHYVWATGRDFALGDAAFSQAMQAALEHAFEREDMPIIRDSHRLMRGADFWSLKPLVLGGDGGGIRAPPAATPDRARAGTALPQDNEADA
jgi:vanillate O-demethylase monooxygenase subunit